MGGYDYHGQGRNTGETRNFRAGRCIGACLEYAARKQMPLMIYVFSDGALSANGVANNDRRRPRQARLGERQPVDRRDVRAGVQAAPAARSCISPTRMQIGSFTRRAVTYRLPARRECRQPAGRDRHPQLHGLHGEEGNFPTLFPTHGLGARPRATASR
jgi:hypothetical protein